jgi:hypothetical protein
MRIKFDMISDPVKRAKLESHDFDPDVAEEFAHELLDLIGSGTDQGSVWTTFEYDSDDGNRVIGYDLTALPRNATTPGRA